MIDAVITYVDGSDKNWLEKYRSKVTKPIEETETRYRSYDCLDLQVRLIRKFMKFVDNIFIVVDSYSQVEKYSFTEEDNVTIVTHEEIIPKRYLPCFNSCAIEMFFYNIKDLKENFVYFNDDVFVVSECSEDDFFVNGKPCISFNEKNIELENNDSIFDHNIANSCNILKEKFPVKRNRKKYVRPSHSIIPLKKSAYTYIWTKCFNDVDKSLTRTRHRRNYNVYLFTNYEYYVRSYVNKKLPMKFYTVIAETQTIYDDIKNDGLKSICMNDIYIYDFNEWKSEFIKMLSCLLNDNQYVAPVKEEQKLIDTPLKIALCAIAKNENIYIREWVKWYKNLGISKIFLYDNNEIDGERFEEVINDYIESGFVEVLNWRGIVKSVKSDKDGQTTQGLAYHDCYYNHYKEFDWMCFFDIDEYLEIYNTYKNIYEFFHDFDEFDGIRVQWKMYGDNNQLYYENKSIFERFKNESNASYDKHVKQIINCNKEFDEELLFCAHGVFNKKYKFVNVLKSKPRNVYMDITAYDNLSVYLNHFYSKSTEEFLKRKYNKTSAVTGVNNTRNFNIEFLKKQYFEYNKLTKEKENMFNLYNEHIEAKNYDHIVISFTSYKERLKTCHLMIHSLLNNTVKPYKICLTVYIDDVMYLTNELREMIKNNVLELIVADKNLRPHLKYFYTMQKYRDYPIITVDDDCLFKEDFIESLINSYKKYPNCVSARRVHKKTYDGNKIRNYEKWIKAYNKILLPSVDIVATGVGGILYPPDILHITDDNLEDIYTYITVDDIYLHYLELKNSIPIVYVPNKKGHPETIEGTQETALCINVNKANDEDDNSPNNVAIRNLIEHI